MGYDNRHTGAITITPPLTWAEIRNATGRAQGITDVRLRIVEETIDTDTGQVVTKFADAVVPLDMTYSGHHVADDIQAIVDHYGPLGHTFAGYIQVQWDPGFDDPTSQRYVVVDGRVETVTPRLAWPGEEQQTDGTREAIAAEVEAYAESIGWYEGGGVWADAIAVIRQEPWTRREENGA